MTIGYLGPRGTFSEQAALRFGDEKSLIEFDTIDDALRAVNRSEIDTAVVPIDNSTEGPVNVTVDTLIFDCDLFIQKLLVFPVSQNLMVYPEHTDERIRKVFSHPQSLAQCRQFLREHYPSAEQVKTSSNGEAARLVIDAGLAAIGPVRAAELSGLRIIGAGIQDNPDNTTYFAFVSKNDTSAPLPDHKTTLAFSTENRPGSLYKILDIFSLWDINMTKIISRPMKSKIGEYVFLIDIEDYDEKDAVDALSMVKRKTSFYKILGTYTTEL